MSHPMSPVCWPVCLIPAKGKSIRIPGKNIKLFHGKPIICYSIAVAKAAGVFGRIIVSTDDERVAKVARDNGAEVMMRGPGLSREDIGPLDVAGHHVDQLAPEVELLCVLYAAAPLLLVADLLRGHEAMKSRETQYAVSVGTVPFLHDAAQFFWCRRSALKGRYPEFGERTRLVPIAPERDCDINTPADWTRAEQLYAKLATVKLVDAYEQPHAADILYQLLAERPKENWISHEKMPTPEEHAAFVSSRPFRFWYLLEVDGVSVGALEVTDLNEIGIALFPKHRKLGYASQALKLFMSTHDPLPMVPAKRNGHWLANIASGNWGSKEFFRKCGFRPLQETYVL